jgi:F0F1-type ATP synthase membrane subunit c/vacuolar-type H+-ATPase subunit K
MPAQSEPQTSIIRRHPTGEFPAVAEPQTSYIEAGEDSQTSYIPRAKPVAVGAPRTARPKPGAAIATAIACILSGWATAVIATDLITGWWRSDRLFCVAIGFLTAVSASALISGLIALLLRRRMGRLLIVVGAVVALLIFAGLFVAGAKLSPVVYAIPVLPVASILLALLPATRRWASGG